MTLEKSKLGVIRGRKTIGSRVESRSKVIGNSPLGMDWESEIKRGVYDQKPEMIRREQVLALRQPAAFIRL